MVDVIFLLSSVSTDSAMEKKKKKSLSVRIDRSLAFISGACYEHSTGDMEIGHALKNGVFEVCLEEGCERVEHVC